LSVCAEVVTVSKRARAVAAPPQSLFSCRNRARSRAMLSLPGNIAAARVRSDSPAAGFFALAYSRAQETTAIAGSLSTSERDFSSQSSAACVSPFSRESTARLNMGEE
jgi:hypothetical protein